MVGTGSAGAVLEISDGTQLAALESLLALDPQVRVSRTPGGPQAGQQGSFDLLTVVAGSGGLVAALRVLPEFIRSRRSRVSITVSVGEKQITLEADNLPQAMALLEKLLDD